jgi:hypothetical protein
MRRATSDEILAEIHADLGKNSSEPGGQDEARDTKDANNLQAREIYIVPEDGNDDLRQKIINLVESLRTTRTMTNDEFRSLIGPLAASNWTGFVEAEASEAWNHITPDMFERIAKAFAIGSGELLK